MKVIKIVLLIFFIGSLGPPFTSADFGANSTFGKIQLGPLRAGEISHVSALARPLTVTNTSDIPVTLNLRLTRPKKGESDPGYEPIPSVTWAILNRNTFQLAPGESASTDIIVKPPREKIFEDRSYQLHILSRIVGEGNVRIILVHKIQFSIIPDSKSEIKELVTTKINHSPNFFQIKDIPLGRLFTGSVQFLELHNMDSRAHRIRIRTFNPEASDEFESYAFQAVPVLSNFNPASFSLNPGVQKSATTEKGFIVTHDVLLPRNWVRVGEPERTLYAGEKIKLPVKIFIPNHPYLMKKTWATLIRVTQLDEPYSSIFIPVYMTTTDQAFSDISPDEFNLPSFVDIKAEISN